MKETLAIIAIILALGWLNDEPDVEEMEHQDYCLRVDAGLHSDYEDSCQ